MTSEDKEILTSQIKFGNLPKIPQQGQRYFFAFFYGMCFGLLFTFLLVWIEHPTSYHYKKITNTYVKAEVNTEVTTLLQNDVRVFCVVLIESISEPKKKLEYLYDSWVKRCNHVIFACVNGAKYNDSQLDMGHNHKIVVFKNFGTMYKSIRDSHEFKNSDWILQTRESSYIVMENLKYLLYPYDPQWKLFLSNDKAVELSDLNSAHVYSKSMYVLIADELKFKEPHMDSHIYDFMKSKNVHFISSKDSKGRERFFTQAIDKIFPIYDKNFNQEFVRKCCSEYLVALQHINGPVLYTMEYYIYKVFPYGVIKKPNYKIPPKKISPAEVIED